MLEGQAPEAGAEVVLTDEEKFLTGSNVSNRYTTLGDPRSVREGDIVRIASVPGTWPLVAQATVKAYSGRAPYSSWDGPISATVSDDGSSVEFVSPWNNDDEFFGPESSLDITASARTDGPPEHYATTQWTAPFAVVDRPAPAPTVAISLSARYALSFQRLTATAVVRTTSIPASTGIVTFAVNGKSVGTVRLTEAADGKASFRLPTLPKGRYSVTATFRPGSGAAAAVSPGAWLRVLR